MQLEVTVRGEDGSERDVKVTAPDDTPLRAVVERLRPDFPEVADGLWSGSRRLPPEVALAHAGLTRGTVVTAGRPESAESPWSLSAAEAVVRLHVVGGPEAGRIEALPAGETVIGRAAESGLVLRDARLSRRHAAVAVTATGIYVRDLGSTNGTRLDDSAVDLDARRLLPGTHLRIGDSTLTVAVGDSPSVAVRPGPDGTVLVERPPAPIAVATESVLVEPVAPGRIRPQQTQVLTALLPALAGVAIALVTHQLLFLAFAVAGPTALLASMLIERRRHRRDDRTATARWRRRRSEAAAELATRLGDEVRTRRATAPDPATIRRAVTTRGNLVWARGREDPGFLEVRVGLADRPSRLMIRRSDREVSAAGTAVSVPVTLSLRSAPLGVCGPAATSMGLVRWLIGQLAVLHSPADLNLGLVGTGDATTWSWLRRLPHFQTSAEPGPPSLASMRERANGASARWTVLVVDRPSPTDLDLLARLLQPGCSNQVTAIWLGEDRRDLPAACTSVVSVGGDAGTRLQVDTADDPSGAVGKDDSECIADQVSRQWVQAVSRELMPLRAAESAHAAPLPLQCRLLELHEPVPHSSAAVREQWECGGRPVAFLGVGADGPVRLDLVQDGPHVLVAGTTGSGKSELLRSLVTSLAVTSSPADLSFILIDYKGGAAFAECAELPHTAGFVTDLDAQLAQRALASLRAELRRREALLAAAGVAELDAYRSASEQRRNPLGRLAIVVDEFATLADELPDLIGGLLGVARRGRSLGIHLVLATQRPAGAISPEIQANLALRIALRVTDPSESMAVIGSAAAAGIDQSQPGRAIIRTGAEVREVQTARIGLPVAAPRGEVCVELLDDWGHPIEPAIPTDEQRTDLRALIESMRQATLETALTVAPSPWLAPLPNSLSLSELDPTDSALRLPIGRLDEPDAQRQSTETIDLDQGSTLLIAGPARSGRTTALHTIMRGATSALTPAQLQLYLVDCAGGGLTALAPSPPHCGAMLTQHEPDAIGRLVSRLRDEVARRQQLAVTDPSSSARPRLLVLIDGWENLVEAIDEVDAVTAHEPGSILDGLLRLLRDGGSSQLTIAIAAGSTNLTSRVLGSIQRTFRLGDVADAIPGRALILPGGNQFQFALPVPERAGRHAEPVPTTPATAQPGPIYVRSLPDRVDLRDLAPVNITEPAGVVLGVAGDRADPIAVDLLHGDGRWLVAGPARSGRTTVLVSILRQLIAARIEVLVAAPTRSPLCTAAADLGLTALDPTSARLDESFTRSRGPRVVLIDDSAAFADQPIEAQLLDLMASAGSGGLGVVAGARADDVSISYRGIAAATRRSGTGILLQPGPAEGELLGVRLPRRRSALPPGRGVLVCDQADAIELRRGRAALPIQLAQ